MARKLSKEEYIKMKREERSALYEKSNDAINLVMSDPYHFIKFLALMATINYSATNSLLVYAQNPNVTEIKDMDAWSEKNIRIKKGEKGIPILSPGGEYKKKDGTNGIGYVIKYVFDVSQTDCKNTREFNVDKDALFHVLDTDEDTIHSSFKEKASYFFDELNMESKNKDFITSCVSYMLSTRYHMKNYNTNTFIPLIDSYFRSKNNVEIKNELSSIYLIYKTCKDQINKDIFAYRKG